MKIVEFVAKTVKETVDTVEFNGEDVIVKPFLALGSLFLEVEFYSEYLNNSHVRCIERDLGERGFSVWGWGTSVSRFNPGYLYIRFTVDMESRENE